MDAAFMFRLLIGIVFLTGCTKINNTSNDPFRFMIPLPLLLK
ncbi:hypothetical protein QW060_25415 [Myroides ceti]|uniref:NADH dehydrogenase subunit 1 n=1 Tax=Paenimyroides ceti TaxID=395087 RepID=A0ABT8D2S2_9FLAO|nr:hypothetical protein [Paenimyroides ceti]MDN3710211.1 hypothetical protein [Paenimyroides ceti]